MSIAIKQCSVMPTPVCVQRAIVDRLLSTRHVNPRSRVIIHFEPDVEIWSALVEKGVAVRPVGDLGEKPSFLLQDIEPDACCVFDASLFDTLPSLGARVDAMRSTVTVHCEGFVGGKKVHKIIKSNDDASLQSAVVSEIVGSPGGILHIDVTVVVAVRRGGQKRVVGSIIPRLVFRWIVRSLCLEMWMGRNVHMETFEGALPPIPRMKLSISDVLMYGVDISRVICFVSGMTIATVDDGGGEGNGEHYMPFSFGIVGRGGTTNT